MIKRRSNLGLEEYLGERPSLVRRLPERGQFADQLDKENDQVDFFESDEGFEQSSHVETQATLTVETGAGGILLVYPSEAVFVHLIGL